MGLFLNVGSPISTNFVEYLSSMSDGKTSDFLIKNFPFAVVFLMYLKFTYTFKKSLRTSSAEKVNRDKMLDDDKKFWDFSYL